jgi:N-carbamoylputrescine amidase
LGVKLHADTSGEIIVTAGNKETVLLCEVDLGKVDATRTHWPFLRDRRIDV